MLAGLVDDLIDKGIASEDQNAICVFFEDNPKLKKLGTPMIVRKSDGAFLYATTDIATVVHRYKHYNTTKAIYVVDKRQILHFTQIAYITAKLGIPVELQVMDFGAVLGQDGRPLKTREGTVVTLASLLDEAELRAEQRIREEGLDVSAEAIETVKRAVGIGAVKYADLHQNRQSDYQFDWDKMISFKGNSGPYLQYAYARIRSIFRKGDIDFKSFESQTLTLSDESEINLAKQLLRFDECIHQATENRLPHILCDHLYALARLFSHFYQHCPVLKADEQTRQSRLLLAKLCASQLEKGLAILGIDVIERM
ncbi:MAG: arginine--tRNA ligase [Myxococcales bacterium]|nr:MAG: arginine--tRNA ligase [Myxococcales bacterium]